MSKPNMQQRRQARFFLIQALYQWHVAHNPIKEIMLQFQLNPLFQKTDQSYFLEAMEAIAAQQEKIDGYFEPYINRKVTEIDAVELSILRLASYEMAERLDVPYRVIINEALDLSKIFGTTDSHKFINSVLDKVAHQLRQVEVSAAAKKG